MLGLFYSYTRSLSVLIPGLFYCYTRSLLLLLGIVGQAGTLSLESLVTIPGVVSSVRGPAPACLTVFGFQGLEKREEMRDLSL